MKRTITSPVVVALFASIFVLGILPKAHAQEKCSVATLEGEYLVTGTAEARLDQRDDPSFPRRSIEVYNFDGAGNMTSFFTQNNGGVVARGTGVTSYTVDPELCTATVTFRAGFQFEFFLATDGSEGTGIRVHDVEPQERAVVATRYMKKR